MITEGAHLVGYASIPMALDHSRSRAQGVQMEDGLADEYPIEVA